MYFFLKRSVLFSYSCNKKTEAGFVIAGDDGATYNVAGADLTKLVGQTVKGLG